MLLSIVIPTKNRYATLFSVVDMILSFDLNDEIEIVIQDNSDDNEEGLSFIEKRTLFQNLKYFYSSEALSQTENSDKAVSNSTGEFVCFIGDDDGVMPNIVQVTKWMQENGFKALKSYKPDYYWPNQKSNYLSNDASGVFKYKRWKENSFRIVKTSDALSFTLDRGAVSIEMLPCLYHGIVERKTLDLIYRKAGTFFPGPSPDMANAVALTQVIEYYVFVDYPVIISGKSTKSIGGSGVLHQHISRIEDVSHLPRDTSENWDIRIPKYWTGPTIWAESLIKALEKFQNRNAIESLNFDYLYAYLKVFHRKHANKIFENFVTKKLLKLKFEIFLYRFRVFILNRIGTVKQLNRIIDMKSAVQAVLKIQNAKT